MTLPGATGRSLPQCRKPPERPSQPYVTAIASASLATPCDGTTRSEHRGSFRVNPNAELLQLRGYTSHHRVRWKTVVSYQLPVVSFVKKSLTLSSRASGPAFGPRVEGPLLSEVLPQ